MKTLPLLLCLAVFAGRVPAQEKIKLADLTLEDGSKLRDTVVLKVEPDGLRLEHRDGVAKVQFEALPEAVRKQFAFDPDKAGQFREEKEAERAVRAAADQKARVEGLLLQRRAQQDLDVAKGREEFYRLLESGEYSFPQLDKVLRDSIADLKAAGRKDLAAELESDRKMLRERELTRPGENARKEKDLLLARIRDLENEVAQINNAPQPVEVFYETGVIPIFVDRPIIISGPPCEKPHPQPPSCPPTVRPVNPGLPNPPATRPVGPVMPSPPAFRPVSPVIPTPPHSPRPSLPVIPSQPTLPTRVSMPSSGAQQFGAHLWKQ